MLSKSLNYQYVHVYTWDLCVYVCVCIIMFIDICSFFVIIESRHHFNPEERYSYHYMLIEKKRWARVSETTESLYNMVGRFSCWFSTDNILP